MFFKQKKKWNIIDVHCHILPCLDDGSQSINETIEMLRVAYDEGIKAMIATPHFKQGYHNASSETIGKQTELVELHARKAGIGIRLYYGNEVLYFDDMSRLLDEGRICTINGTDYVLVEFLPSDSYTHIRNAVSGLLGDGYIPIVAHAERYMCMLEHVTNLRELKNMGAELQINASSIMGKLGPKVKKLLAMALKGELIDYVGTDAHDSKRRKPEIEKCAEYLYKKYDKGYIDCILYQNAEERLLER